MASFEWPEKGTGGGGGGAADAAGTVNIGSGVSSIVVAYDVTLTSAIAPIFSFINSTDSAPIFLIGFISAFSTSGFTVTFNAATDSANYKMSYAVFGAV